MRTAVRRILLLSALMSPGALYALGLGEIHLNSALNQPFDADIELVAATDEDLGALRAALAPSDAFARYGLDRPAYLADFTFRVAKGANGADVLKVTSPRAVTEPFVTLLVEASWPRGRLLREYTVLLDPPIYAPTPAAAEPAVATPRAASTASPATARPESSATPAAPASTSRLPRAVAAAPSLEGGTTYRVQPNDTLWKIASAVNPGSRSAVNRAMVAIYQQNTHAFDGNINVLRSGALLKIPQASEIDSISASAASAEVARQYQVWREGGAAAGAGAEAGRLRLVTPEQGTAAPSTATTPATPAGPETAAGAQPGTTTDLNNRVKQLESELAEARRLLEVRNAELATLQGQPAPGATPTAGAAAAPQAGTTAAPAPAAPAAGQPEAAPTPEQPAVAPPAEAAKPAPTKPESKAATPPPKKPAEGPTLVERLTHYWWLLAGLLAVLAGVALFKRMRSGGEGAVDLEEALGRDLRATRTSAGARAPRESEIVVEERRPVEAAAPRPAPAAKAPEPSRKPVSIEDTLSGEAPASIEAGDPLAEADFHMAYGLYDQAADLVQLAIKREPTRRELKLKLLEIYFVWGNRDRFLDVAREMNSTRGEAQPGEWDKVLIMGKQIAPEDPIFAGAPRTAAGSLDMELHAATPAIDMDLGATTALREPDLDLTGRGPQVSSESGLDFVLDEPERGAADTATLAPTVEAAALAPTVEAATLAPTVETAQLASTVETQRIPKDGSDTEEVALETLGLDVDTLRGLDDLDKTSEFFAAAPKTMVDDTIEKPAVKATPGAEGDEEDLLASTSLMKMSEELQGAATSDQETAVLDLSDVTGELPILESGKLATKGVDFSLGEEAATMSEVGTKLDLARAYIDMGDPEGARSILGEVLQEGSSTQKQEAQRLIAGLP